MVNPKALHMETFYDHKVYSMWYELVTTWSTPRGLYFMPHGVLHMVYMELTWIFFQIQKSPKHPREGGSSKLWTFSTICDIFLWLPLVSISLMSGIDLMGGGSAFFKNISNVLWGMSALIGTLPRFFSFLFIDASPNGSLLKSKIWISDSHICFVSI